MDTREVFELLRKVGVPVGIVNSVEEGAKLVGKRGIIGEAEYKGKVYRCVSFSAKFSNYVVKRKGKVSKSRCKMLVVNSILRRFYMCEYFCIVSYLFVLGDFDEGYYC